MNPRRSPLPTDVGSLPHLPPAFEARLSAGLETLGVEITAAQRTALEDHLRLLLAWNEAINLTAIRDPVVAATAHVLDSLTAVPLLRTEGVDAFVDIGSGGGFPGIPLAIALPDARALLADSIAKKVRFLETAVHALGLEARVAASAGRVETLAHRPADRARWPAVVARAVGSLPELAELGLPLLRDGGLLVAWKRLPLDDELAAMRHVLPGLGGSQPQLNQVIVDGLGGHVLVVVRKLHPTPPGYPRDPRVRKLRPGALMSAAGKARSDGRAGAHRHGCGRAFAQDRT